MPEKNNYDNIDPKDYETRHKKNQKERYLYDHWEPLFIAAIDKYSKNLVVLDLGCGPGNYAFLMSKLAKKVFAIDSSKRMIDYAKGKYPGIDLIFADATNTPLQSNSIDTIFSFGLFEFVDRKKLMKEISRILRPGGKVVISVPNKYSIPRFLFSLFYKLKGKKNRCNEPSFNEMKKAFREFSFKIVECKMDDGLFWIPYVNKFFGKKTFLFIEKLFKIFKRNPFSTVMFFVIQKR